MIFVNELKETKVHSFTQRNDFYLRGPQLHASLDVNLRYAAPSNIILLDRVIRVYKGHLTQTALHDNSDIFVSVITVLEIFCWEVKLFYASDTFT